MADPALETSIVLYRVDGGRVDPEFVIVDVDQAEQLTAHSDHFAALADAWDWLERDVRAQRSLVAGEIVRLRSALSRAETEAADAVVREAEIRKRREKS